MSITERLHDHLHKLPGMPPHDEAARLNRNQNRHAHHNTKPPRVLVTWQNWIGGLFTGGRR